MVNREAPQDRILEYLRLGPPEIITAVPSRVCV